MTMFYLILAFHILYSTVVLSGSMAPFAAGTPEGVETTPANISLLSTFQSISVKAPFSGDSNANNAASVQFRQVGTPAWLTAYTPFIDHRQRLDGVLNPYAGQARVSIVGLSPNTKYEVQVTW